MNTDTNRVQVNPIIRFAVRRPGECAYSFHRSEKAAHRGAEVANRVCQPGHRVYAEHKNGAVTGPYHK